MKIKES